MGMFSPKSEKTISDYFSDDDLKKIAAATYAAEGKTSGEIRVMVRMRCERGLEGKIHEQALRDFASRGLAETRDKTGVLVLVVLEERKFTILADKGIYEKLPSEYWHHRAQEMAAYFRDENYVDGICNVVADIGEKLTLYFPRGADDVDELSNEVITEDGR